VLVRIMTWDLSIPLVSTWMGDHQGRLGTVNLGPFVGVDLNLGPAVYIADIVLTRTSNESNQTYIRQHDHVCQIYSSNLCQLHDIHSAFHSTVIDHSNTAMLHDSSDNVRESRLIEQ